MARNENELVLNITPISLSKQFVQPVTINDEFASYVCYKHVEVERQIIVGGKDKGKKTAIERAPLMITWNGKKFQWFLCRKGEEIEVNKKHYIIDRDIDDSPMLPSEDFIGRILSPEWKRMVKDFKPEDFFDEVFKYFERYFYLEKPYLYKILTLFVINCWVFDAHESTPYLFIRSPVMGCGKTHLGVSVTSMVNGQMNTNFKAHHLFRIVHGTKTVAGFDEIKKWSDKGYKMSDDTKDIISLVNVGFQKDGSRVPRLVETKGGSKGEMSTILYDSFAPKIMITTTGQLPADTVSRCIEIIIQRAPPKGNDYGERWYEPERKKTLKKIREMGFMFRLLYGREIASISEDKNWRDEIDITDTFGDLKNRELEIYRPLVILALKYRPEWKTLVDIYVRKNIEMRSTLDPTPVNSILFAMRHLYNEVARSSWDTIESDELGSVEIKDDAVYGPVLVLNPKAIAVTVERQVSFNMFGDNAPSKIGKELNKLGFYQEDKTARNRHGRVRIIKISQLEDMVERYLAMELSDKKQDERGSQAERIQLVRELLLSAGKEGMTFDELSEATSEYMTEDRLKEVLKHLKGITGDITQMGKAFVWEGH